MEYLSGVEAELNEMLPAFVDDVTRMAEFKETAGRNFVMVVGQMAVGWMVYDKPLIEGKGTVVKVVASLELLEEIQKNAEKVELH